MDQLQREPRFNTGAVLARPTTKQIPSAQTQVLGKQQPKADHVAVNLVSQELAHTAFQAGRITRFRFGAFLGSLGLDRWFRDRTTAVEFFFEGQILR